MERKRFLRGLRLAGATTLIPFGITMQNYDSGKVK